MDYLPANLLRDYARAFYGYGSAQAKLWFVGMEEGGGNTIDDVAGRLEAWRSVRKKTLQDLKAFHLARGERRWHTNPPALQPTWEQLIRLHRLAHGLGDSWQELVDCQHNSFGKADGDTCVIELLPLPSPHSRAWKYAEWSRLPWLVSREAYTRHLLQYRISAIQKAITMYRPPVVVFYGSSLLEHWQKIARTTFGQAINGRLRGAVKDGIAYYVAWHPTYRPPKDDYFREVGKFIHKEHHGALCQCSG